MPMVGEVKGPLEIQAVNGQFFQIARRHIVGYRDSRKNRYPHAVFDRLADRFGAADTGHHLQIIDVQPPFGKTGLDGFEGPPIRAHG